MRSFITLLSLFSLAATSIFASPVSRNECDANSEFCQGTALLDSSTVPTITDRAIDVSTNAERFARGLPPKKPKLVAGSPVRRTQPSSVPPVSYRGYIQIKDKNSNVLGYISKNLGNSGAQFVSDPSIANALIVDFQLPAGATSGSTLDFTIENSNPSWPLLGMVQGRDDTDSNISTGSYQYLYVGGISTPGTDPNATPQSISNSYFIGAPRTAESAVWSIDLTSGAITAQWVNTDGSKPPIQTWTQSTGLYFGGNSNAFFARYPAPVTLVTYTFVPI
jgi:hypothetical protein